MSFLQKAVVKGTIASTVQFRNIFYADIDPFTPDTEESLWNDYLDAIYTTLFTGLSNVVQIYAFDLYQKTGAEWIFKETYEYTQGGGSALSPSPNYLAGVLIGKIIGNRAFGRKFIVGLPQGTYAGNSVTAPVLVTLATAALAYVSPIINSPGGTLQPGIVTKDGAFHAFSQGLVSSLLGTMRRRKPGLGI